MSRLCESHYHFRIYHWLLEFEVILVSDRILIIALVSENEQDLAMGALSYLEVLKNP